MTKEIENQKYTYSELMYTFLAGSRMASEHHINWMEAFNRWMEYLQKAKNNALDLS